MFMSIPVNAYEYTALFPGKPLTSYNQTKVAGLGTRLVYTQLYCKKAGHEKEANIHRVHVIKVCNSQEIFSLLCVFFYPATHTVVLHRDFKQTSQVSLIVQGTREATCAKRIIAILAVLGAISLISFVLICFVSCRYAWLYLHGQHGRDELVY